MKPMDKTCPKCLYKGESKFLVIEDFSIPIGGFLIGFGFMLLSVDKFSRFFTLDSPLLLISIFLMAFTGFLILMNCYNKNRDICSKCGYDHMIENDALAIENPIEHASLDQKEKICTNCYHIGKEYRTVYFFILAPILLIIFGTGFLTKLGLFPNPLMAAVTGLIWLGFGIYTLKVFLSHPFECPNCKNKRTMIPLDTPRAQALIKEHNIAIPEATQQQTSIPNTSQ
jgi:hypothetical protein